MSVLDEILKTIQHPGPPPFNPNEPHSDAHRRYALELADRAGQMHKVIFDDAFSSGSSDMRSIMMRYLREIHELKGVSEPELTLLEKIVESMTSRSSAEHVAEEVAGVHAELLSRKGDTSPIAVAISAIAVDSTDRARHASKHNADVRTVGGTTPVATPFGRVALADVMGAIGGARLGLALPIFPWAVVGLTVICGGAASIALAA
jgi:hypothetical protein